MISALHQAALDYAAKGWPVFPLAPRTKVPREGSKGFHEATTDPAVINSWWSEEPDLNIGFQPQKVGLTVVDPDGDAGLATWAELELEHGASPDTMTVRTPRGGLHLYFTGYTPPTQSVLGPHVDTRGGGSYVLLPPSVFYDPATGLTGSYSFERALPPADLPPWVLPRIEELQAAVKEGSGIALDLPANVARARRHLERMVRQGTVAVEGEMGDLLTFQTACALRDYGLSADLIADLMLELWNPHCEPPWEEEDLRAKVENASRYAQNGEGAWAAGDTLSTFAEALGKLGVDSQGAPRRSKFALLSEADQDSLPEPQWLIPNLITTDAIGMIYGPSMTFKSFLAMDIGMSMASGIEAWGQGGKPRPVVYVAGEGPFAIARKRRPVWKMARQVDGSVPFYLVGSMPHAVQLDEVDAFIDEVKASGVQPGLIIIDTLARFMGGLDEASAKDAGVATIALERIKEKLGCSVLVIHHTGKDTARGARGSSAFLGNFDAQHEVARVEGTMAVSLIPRKQKDAELGKDWLFEGKALGGSLVFDQVDSTRFQELTGQTSVSSLIGRVRRALTALGAVGEEKWVTAHVLASAMQVQAEGDSPEEHEARVARLEQTLVKQGKGLLGGYCYDGKWGFPDPVEPA